MSIRFVLPLCACALAAASRWTSDDVLLQERVDSVELGPGARLAAYAKVRMDKDKGEAVSNLFLYSAGDGSTVQLTRGKDNDTAPRFSPDGRRIAYLLIDGLPAGALLKPVGSMAGSGDDPVYDLGGNAAEWVVAKDGTGKALGGSADRPVDAKSASAARGAYTGFRVVRD